MQSGDSGPSQTRSRARVCASISALAGSFHAQHQFKTSDACDQIEGGQETRRAGAGLGEEEVVRHFVALAIPPTIQHPAMITKHHMATFA